MALRFDDLVIDSQQQEWCCPLAYKQRSVFVPASLNANNTPMVAIFALRYKR